MYRFRREDSDQIVEVDFSTMMTKDVMGYITLPDGTTAREVRESSRSTSRDGRASSVDRPIVSDALGFGESQLAEFERDRVANGFTGVEFVRDAHVPQFFQAKFSSRKEWARYVRHRGARDQNSVHGGGGCLTPDSLKRAEAIAKRSNTLDDLPNQAQD